MLFHAVLGRQTPIKTYTTQPQKASMWRQVRSAVSKVLGDFAFSVGSYFLHVGGVDVDPNSETMDNLRNNGVDTVYHSLKQKRALKGASVGAYFNHLATQHDNFTYVNDYLLDFSEVRSVGELIQKAMTAKPTATKIAVPIVLHGTFRDHIVVFFIDTEAKTLEYYDPKGNTIMDNKNTSLTADRSDTLGNLYFSIKQTRIFESVPTVKENVHKHQFDSHNCGVFVLHYTEERLAGNSAETIFTDDVNSFKANSSYRRKLIENIIKNSPHIEPSNKTLDTFDIDDFYTDEETDATGDDAFDGGMSVLNVQNLPIGSDASDNEASDW